MSKPKHCDDYIDDYHTPSALRWFLFINRLSADMKSLADLNGCKPILFADFNGKRVRVVMASRIGDVGITTKLKNEIGYEGRVFVEELSNFSNKG